MKPSVSILLPVYNGEGFVAECIESVLCQSNSDFELLIADDCSTDGTVQILKKISDKRVHVLQSTSNVGLFMNVNRLLQVARAPLIRFLCQDDTLEPHCLDEERRFFQRNGKIGMSYCKAVKIDQYGNVLAKCELHDVAEVIEPKICQQMLFYFGCIPGNLSTVCVRRDCILDLGLFDPSYAVSADYELWVRICRRFPMGVIHQHLIRLRSHQGQLSRSNESGIQCIRADRRIRAILMGELPEPVRNSASWYSKLRHDVLAVHHAYRCLQNAKTSEFLRIVHILGIVNFLSATIFWLLTCNNHLYRPKPTLVN